MYKGIEGYKSISHDDWYYSIELRPGIFTPGEEFTNVAITRELLRRLPVEGRRCLDIGMMEGLITMLMERRGAAHVVGYDRINRPNMMRELREVLGARYELIAGMKLADLPRELETRGHKPFDIAVFSGVLYYMFDPLAGLATVRGLVRNGGLLLVETMVTLDDAIGAHFNAAARFFRGTNYWLLTAPCLDYLLRFVGLRPIDCAYFRIEPHGKADIPTARLAVVCRAAETELPTSEDDWMLSERVRDLGEFFDWRGVESDSPDVPYNATTPGLVLRADVEGAIDVAATVKNTAEYPVSPEQCRLALDDKY